MKPILFLFILLAFYFINNNYVNGHPIFQSPALCVYCKEFLRALVTGDGHSYEFYEYPIVLSHFNTAIKNSCNQISHNEFVLNSLCHDFANGKRDQLIDAIEKKKQNICEELKLCNSVIDSSPDISDAIWVTSGTLEANDDVVKIDERGSTNF